MPRYDYSCGACGQTSEIVKRFWDEPPRSCPKCGAIGVLTRIYSTPIFILKGSGWAKKDKNL